jgi:pyridoxine 4-dehydrogenase
MRRDGLIRHLGLSVVDGDQVTEAQSIAPIVTVQNWYNLAHRGDEGLIAALGEQGVSYAAFWPLGGFAPLQHDTLDDVAQRLGVTPAAVAIAWLLHQAPNIVVIPGTSQVAHLRENLAAADLDLPPDALAELDGIAGAG